MSPLEDYSEIISDMQKETWIHTVENKTLIPSQDCLTLREKNLSFQLQVWTQATNPTIRVPVPSDYGWEQKEHGLCLQADSVENMSKQKSFYDAIMRKCGCKTSQCLTGRCCCKKAGSKCTELCACLNCENTDHSGTNTSESSTESIVTMEEDEICSSESETEEAVDSDLDVDQDF